MTNAFLAIFFKTYEDAQRKADELNKGRGVKFRVLVGKDQCLVASEPVLRKAGLLPKKKIGQRIKEEENKGYKPSEIIDLKNHVCPDDGYSLREENGVFYCENKRCDFFITKDKLEKVTT